MSGGHPTFLSAFVIRDKAKEVATHTSLAGGSYHVPTEKYRSTFLPKYLDAFRGGWKLYLTERVPKGVPFRWFADLDYPFTDAVRDWSPPNFRRFYKLNETAVHLALVEAGLLLCNHTVKLSVRASKIHLHVPGLVLQADAARAFLNVVRTVIETDPIKSDLLALLGAVNFDNVFDASVYSSGLRMLGSYKVKVKDPDWVHHKFYQMVDEDADTTADTTAVTAPSASVEGAYTVITNEDDLTILKAGLKQIDLRPRECLTFKKYPHTIVVELDDLFCQRLQRKHTSNRAFLVISATTVTRKCSSPQCASIPASSVQTAIGVFPDDFKSVVKQLLDVQQPVPVADDVDLPVADIVAQQRFEHHNSWLPGTAELECVRRNNILISKVVKHPTVSRMTDVESIICGRHDRFCKGTQYAQTSAQGLKIICDTCSFRFPESSAVFMSVPVDTYPLLSQYLIQVNNNVTTTNNITVNNYNVEDVHLDLQFDTIEPIFPDPEFNRLMFRSFNGDAGDIAYVVYYMGRDRLGLVPLKKDSVDWWGWDSRVGRWNTGKHYLETFCMRTMVPYYEQAQQYFRLHTTDLTLAKNREIRFLQIRKRLNDRELVHTVASAATHFRTYSPNFKDYLDANPALIGFTNGVYDLDADEFREANPADYMTMSCKYDFEREVNPAIRAEIDKFFKDIQPEDDVRRYLQKFLGSCIRGGQKAYELFHILTGETRNGKSVLADIMKYALGDYYTTISSTMLTSLQGSSAQASPDLMALKNRRLAIASEPEKGKTINSGFMKGLTGNDDIVARPLYGDIVTFKPTHATVFLTNDIPPMDQSDAAVRARVVVVPFPTTFKDVVTSKTGSSRGALR
ncbi:hypothetical protein HDU78_000787 [Chytriomyces hyalinus]|nr:hypothetical protein HDU78_000787 [Chytriomyces hyalinus]